MGSQQHQSKHEFVEAASTTAHNDTRTNIIIIVVAAQHPQGATAANDDINDDVDEERVDDVDVGRRCCTRTTFVIAFVASWYCDCRRRIDRLCKHYRILDHSIVVCCSFGIRCATTTIVICFDNAVARIYFNVSLYANSNNVNEFASVDLCIDIAHFIDIVNISFVEETKQSGLFVCFVLFSIN